MSHATQLQRGASVCVCVFSLWRTRANYLHPANKCPHTTQSMFSLLSSHTPVTIQQLAITSPLWNQIHTHTLFICPLATTVVPLSSDESLFATFHSELLQDVCVCVCECVCTCAALCYLNFSSASTHCYPVKRVKAASVKNMFKEELGWQRLCFDSVRPVLSSLKRSVLKFSNLDFIRKTTITNKRSAITEH